MSIRTRCCAFGMATLALAAFSALACKKTQPPSSSLPMSPEELKVSLQQGLSDFLQKDYPDEAARVLEYEWDESPFPDRLILGIKWEFDTNKKTATRTHFVDAKGRPTLIDVLEYAIDDKSRARFRWQVKMREIKHRPWPGMGEKLEKL
jgi:hypothetical protein